MNLPLELMTPKGVSYVASGIGLLVCLDKSIGAVRKAGVAKVCVEPQDELPNSIKVMLEDDSTIEVAVEYPWKPASEPAQKRWIPKVNVVREPSPSRNPTSSTSTSSAPTLTSVEVAPPPVINDSTRIPTQCAPMQHNIRPILGANLAENSHLAGSSCSGARLNHPVGDQFAD